MGLLGKKKSYSCVFNAKDLTFYKIYWNKIFIKCDRSNEQLYGPGHAKMCLMSYANNKGADQPAHPRSLISTFVVRCLDRIMALVSISENSRL